MTVLRRTIAALVFYCCLASSLVAQSSAPKTGTAPQFIRISGTVSDNTVRRSGTAGVLFSLYATQDGGAPLWTESQSVRIDVTGHYSALLGSNTAEGVPVALFANGEIRWLGISIDGNEQPRMQLVSVPYALKANESDTLNGLTAADIIAQASSGSSQSFLSSRSTTRTTTRSAMISSSVISPYAVTASTATSFTDSNSTEVVLVQQNGTGYAIHAISPSSTAVFGENTGTSLPAIFGSATSTTGTAPGVLGQTASPDGIGVFGHSTSLAGTTTIGVRGVAEATSGTTFGVRGTVYSPNGYGVFGQNLASTGTTAGVQGSSASVNGRGLIGQSTSPTGLTIGLLGFAASTSGSAIYAQETATSGSTTGLRATVASPNGVAAVIDNLAGGQILLARSGSSPVTKFSVDGTGNVTNAGTITSTGAITAPNFIGSGAGLTNVDATKLTNGAIVYAPPSSANLNFVIGSNNQVTTGVQGATIAGGGTSGSYNSVTDDYSFVGGGIANRAGDGVGTTSDSSFAAVVGGNGNRASAPYSFIGGGVSNLTGGSYSTIAGGSFNTASNINSAALSGASNTASEYGALVAGGYGNSASGYTSTIAGGFQNAASAQSAAVGGGSFNVAGGTTAVVPGGSNNVAGGAASFAAGSYAKASYNNQFVWADGTAIYSGLNAPSSFSVLSTGGVLFNTHMTSGVPDQAVAIDTAGIVTASGGFNGDGSLLTNVNSARLQGVPVTNAAPSSGQALRYNGSAWAPSTFADVHYYPAGHCDPSGNFPAWSASASNYTCATDPVVVMLYFNADATGTSAGPQIVLPSDWDGSPVSVSTDWFLPSGNGTLSTSLMWGCPGSTPATASSYIASTNPDVNLSVTDTSFHKSVGTLTLPASCTAGSTMQVMFGRADANTSIGPISVLGMTITIQRKQ